MPAIKHYLLPENATEFTIQLTSLYNTYGHKKTDNEIAFTDIIEAVKAYHAKLQQVRDFLTADQIKIQEELERNFLRQYSSLQNESPDSSFRWSRPSANDQALAARIKKEASYLKSAITLSTKLLEQIVNPAVAQFDQADFASFHEIKQGIEGLEKEKDQTVATRDRARLWGGILLGIGITLLVLSFAAIMLAAAGPLAPAVCAASFYLSFTLSMSIHMAMELVLLGLVVPYFGGAIMAAVGKWKLGDASAAQRKLDVIEPKLNFYRNIDKKAPNITLFNANAAVQAQPVLVPQGSQVQQQVPGSYGYGPTVWQPAPNQTVAPVNASLYPPLEPVYRETNTATNTVTKRQ